MNIEIANRLQHLRKEKGLSQEQLAAELGISRQAVSKWERAESSPDTDNLICLAKLYGISLDELLSTEATIEEIKEEKELEEADDEEYNGKLEVLHGISLFLIIITYFILGITLSWWHPAWILFLFIPINSSLIEAIKNKDPHAFAYPVFVTAVYLFLGCVLSWWHPGWLIFITIPLYYLVCDFIKR